MKNILLIFLIALLMDGVFSELVSVIKGDSVTLHTDLTEIQKNDVIQWRFKTTLIIQFNTVNKKISTYDVLDGRFRDRLKLDDQTGSLTITNITTQHAGDYEVSNLNTLKRSFIVSVVSADEVKPVSVLEGDSVTLRTDPTYTQIYDEIRWRIDHLKSPIAEINRKTGIFNTSDGPDGRFRDRLQLDCLTGSLTIKNIGIRHSGLYKADISSSKHTIHKTFNVTVRDAVKSLSVKEGETITLQTNVTEIQSNDHMLWMFGDTVLAEINKAAQQFSTYDGPDGRFRDRLKLDHQTGSLIITNTRTTDSGLYEVKISSSRYTINRRITVTVNSGLSPAAKAWIGVGGVLLVAAAAAGGTYCCCKISQPKLSCKTLSVIEGETVPLHPSGNEIIKEDNIRWLFNKSPLAEIKRKPPAPFNVLLENFKGRLDGTENLGPLIIKNIQIKDSGFYELQIIRSENNIQTLEIFSVTVYAKTDEIKIKEVKEGGSVTLESGVTGIQKDDEILWKFGLENNSHIAAIQGGTKKTPPFGAGWRFKFRLNLDENGSLTIRNIRPLDTGFYVLHITRHGNTSLHLFMVKISNSSMPEEIRLINVGTSNS